MRADDVRDRLLYAERREARHDRCDRHQEHELTALGRPECSGRDQGVGQREDPEDDLRSVAADRREGE